METVHSLTLPSMVLLNFKVCPQWNSQTAYQWNFKVFPQWNSQIAYQWAIFLKVLSIKSNLEGCTF
jgi:hypothetical protein